MSDFVEILTADEHRLINKTKEKGFIVDFERWAAMKTDAPSYTLRAAALQALSLAAGDQVTLEGIFSDAPTYLNLYVMVVGPSTTMRKTTVLNYVRGLLPVQQQDKSDYITFMDDVSNQAFNKVMADAGKKRAPIMLSIDEVAGLFEVIRRKNSYLAGFDKTLMKAYDHSPVSIHRTNSAIDAPNGAYVNIFAASTPDPLMEVLNGEDVESGLLPRFIIFDARETQRGRRISLMERKKHDAEWLKKKGELQDFLYSIAKGRADGVPNGADQYGPTYPSTIIGMSDEAMERLDAIDAVFDAEASKDSTAFGAIKGRAFWHIVKLSGLFALSRAGRNAKVELIDALRAALLVESTMHDLALMSQEVGANKQERNIKEVLKIISETKDQRIAQAVIARRLTLSGRELIDLRGTLIGRGLITHTKIDDTPYWEAT